MKLGEGFFLTKARSAVFRPAGDPVILRPSGLRDEELLAAESDLTYAAVRQPGGWRLHLRPPAARMVCAGVAVLGAASIAVVRAALPCAPDDFSCWDALHEPIDMYARLEEDLHTLDWGGCPAVCLMTADEIHVVCGTAAFVGAIFFACRRAPGIAGKIAAVTAAAFGAYAATQTKEFIGFAKSRCQQNSCPTEPLW